MSTTHCTECGSRMCNHGTCPECDPPCRHCDGGDPHDKFFGYDPETGLEINSQAEAQERLGWPPRSKR